MEERTQQAKTKTEKQHDVALTFILAAIFLKKHNFLIPLVTYISKKFNFAVLSFLEAELYAKSSLKSGYLHC